jgi:hypothetical protein
MRLSKVKAGVLAIAGPGPRAGEVSSEPRP